jgi:hypothetical protein
MKPKVFIPLAPTCVIGYLACLGREPTCRSYPRRTKIRLRSRIPLVYNGRLSFFECKMNYPESQVPRTGRQKIPGQRARVVRDGGNYPKRYSPTKPYIPARESNPAPFWEGPYGMLVPSTVSSVPYFDGGNVMYRDGKISDTYVDPKQHQSRERYLGMYATPGRDARWYYTPRKKPCVGNRHH